MILIRSRGQDYSSTTLATTRCMNRQVTSLRRPTARQPVTRAGGRGWSLTATAAAIREPDRVDRLGATAAHRDDTFWAVSVGKQDAAGNVLLLIVGAGASHDAIPFARGEQIVSALGLPERPFSEVKPPLAQQLVTVSAFHNEVASRYPMCAPVLAYLRRRIAVPSDTRSQTVALETALGEYRERSEMDPRTAQQLAAMLFYLRDLLWESTLYSLSDRLNGPVTNFVELIDIARRWALAQSAEVCVVDFNYDLLVEYGCNANFNFRLHDLDSYLADALLKILKPHGSVNWAHPFASNVGTGATREERASRAIEALFTARHTDEIRIDSVAAPGAAPLLSGREPYVPALALPIAGKTEFVWPTEQLAHLRSLKGRVTHVIAIGWRAAEEHFLHELNTLSAPDCHVRIVTGGPDAPSDADTVHHALSRSLGSHRVGISTEVVGFGPWINSTSLYDFLELQPPRR
jgi:hypothetical protein